MNEYSNSGDGVVEFVGSVDHGWNIRGHFEFRFGIFGLGAKSVSGCDFEAQGAPRSPGTTMTFWTRDSVLGVSYTVIDRFLRNSSRLILVYRVNPWQTRRFKMTRDIFSSTRV